MDEDRQHAGAEEDRGRDQRAAGHSADAADAVSRGAAVAESSPVADQEAGGDEGRRWGREAAREGLGVEDAEEDAAAEQADEECGAPVRIAAPGGGRARR